MLELAQAEANPEWTTLRGRDGGDFRHTGFSRSAVQAVLAGAKPHAMGCRRRLEIAHE